MSCTSIGTADRRRKFWVTQPDACGVNLGCDTECGSPGLALVKTDQGTTIDTSNYVRGIALNILLTDARKDPSTCGNAPGDSRGHWTDSFRSDGLTAGTKLRYLTPQGSFRDSVNQAVAFATADMQKLVAYGIAKTVDVSADIVGGSRVRLNIVINGQLPDVTRVNVTGTRLANSWLWSE